MNTVTHDKSSAKGHLKDDQPYPIQKFDEIARSALTREDFSELNRRVLEMWETADHVRIMAMGIVEDIKKYISHFAQIQESHKASPLDFFSKDPQQSHFIKPDISDISNLIIDTFRLERFDYHNYNLYTLLRSAQLYYVEVPKRWAQELRDIIEDRIEGKPQFDHSSDLEARLASVEDFARRHEGRGVANFIRDTFPELFQTLLKLGSSSDHQDSALPVSDAEELMRSPPAAVVEQPVAPPAKWADRVKSRGQNPIPYLQASYRAELQQGMTIGELRMRDDHLAKAVMRWAEKEGLPQDLKLDMRTRQQRNDDELAQLEQELREGQEPSFSLREASRIKSAQHRRREK